MRALPQKGGAPVLGDLEGLEDVAVVWSCLAGSIDRWSGFPVVDSIPFHSNHLRLGFLLALGLFPLSHHEKPYLEVESLPDLSLQTQLFCVLELKCFKLMPLPRNDCLPSIGLTTGDYMPTQAYIFTFCTCSAPLFYKI